jgi:hypothetical protein
VESDEQPFPRWEGVFITQSGRSYGGSPTTKQRCPQGGDFIDTTEIIDNSKVKVKRPVWTYEKSTPPFDPSTPYKERVKILEAYKMFDILEPSWSNDAKCRYGQILRATKEFYCLINDNLVLKRISEEVCTRSILEKGFNEKYSKVYKYSRQCCLGINWNCPADFPVPLLNGKINSWKSFRQAIGLRKPATPEILIPGELLYPWLDEKPSDIEYLEDEYRPESIDKDSFREILGSLLIAPKRIPKMCDFVVSQTNTKRIHTCSNLRELRKKGKKAAMAYKYQAVTRWVDRGCPDQEPIAVRTPVWKRTTEYRDAISLNPDTLYQVWELNSYLKQMIKHPGVGDYTDMRELKQFYHKHTSFILTDWKKSGLTMPHWYIKLLVEEVSKKAPQYSGRFPTQGLEIYDYDKDKVFYNESFGYGLGMINNAYTLFNICLFEYAKKQNIFTEKDSILSFNDDSVIGCEKTSYHQWINVCSSSGAYLDVHKTVQTDCIQFCEMHIGKVWKNSFKWVSSFHTLYKTMEESVNYTEWRFRASDTWDAIRGYQSQLIPEIPNEVIMGTIVDLVMTGAANYFGTDTDIGNPEYGGVLLGKYGRTQYDLKDTLLVLEASTGKDYFYKASCLRLVKEALKPLNYPVYRDWEKFPEGKTKTLMTMIGSLHGLNHELESMLAKAQNRFVIDTKYVNHKLWTTLENKILKLNPDDPPIFNVVDYLRGERWPNCAVPSCLVTSEMPVSHNYLELPFVRMEKEENKYSIIKMIEELYYLFRGHKPSIPEEDVTLKGFIQWETPVYPDVDKYHPICDMELISKIADFNDPRRVFLDYWARSHSVITGLATEDLRGRAAQVLLDQLTGIPRPGGGTATWYTRIPLPLDDMAKKILSTHLPTYHEEILMDIVSRRREPDEFPTIDEYSYDKLIDYKEHNKRQWSKWTKSKRISEAKKRPTKKKQPASEDNPPVDIMDINMDQIRTVFDKIGAEFTERVQSLKQEQSPPSTGGEATDTPSGFNYNIEALRSETLLDSLDEPDWLREGSTEYNPDDYFDEGGSFDEAEEIAYALDQANLAWYCEEDG